MFCNSSLLVLHALSIQVIQRHILALWSILFLAWDFITAACWTFKKLGVCGQDQYRCSSRVFSGQALQLVVHALLVWRVLSVSCGWIVLLLETDKQSEIMVTQTSFGLVVQSSSGSRRRPADWKMVRMNYVSPYVLLYPPKWVGLVEETCFFW